MWLQETRRFNERSRAPEILKKTIPERMIPIPAVNQELVKAIGERAQVQEEQRKLALLVENSGDFIGIAGLDGKALFVNPAGQRTVGLDNDEQVRNTRIIEYVKEEERGRIQHEVLPRVFREGAWEGETLFRHFKTGAAIPMLQHIFLIREQGTDRPIALATISSDISERERAEEALRNSNEKLLVSNEELRLATQELESKRNQLQSLNEELQVIVAELARANSDMQNLMRSSDIAEEKAHEANERVRLILDSITDAFFGFSKDWQFTYLNKHAAEQMSVLGKDPDALIGKVLWDEFPEVPNEDAVRRVMSERVVVTDELYYPPLGEWVENHMYPSNDGGVVIFQRYITDRKQAETELVKLKDELANELAAMTRLHELSNRLMRETELKPLLEEVLNATMAFQNADFGLIQLFNPETSALEIVAQQGFAPESLDYFRTVGSECVIFSRALLQAKRIFVEDVEKDLEFRRQVGPAASVGFRAVQSTPLFGGTGAPLGIVSTLFRQPHRPSERELRLSDLYAGQAVMIIERKRAEDELRRSEAYLAEGQKLSHTGSWALNVSTGEVFWSLEHYRIWGLDAEKTRVTSDLFFASLHTEDLDFVHQSFAASLAGKKEFDCTYRIVHPTKVIRYIHSLGHPVFDRAQNVTEFVGTVIDITDRVFAEEALRRAHVELAHATRVTTIGELTASIAHEVNQPLGAIVSNGNAALRLLSRDEPDLAGAQEAIECIIADAMRSSEVTKKIRALFKKAVTEKAAMNVNDLIREVITLASGELAKNQVSLRVDLGKDFSDVHGDRVQLQQVLLNLILNGSDALSAEGWERRELLIKSEQTGPDEVLVTVSDSGPGLGTQNIERVFEPFFSTKEGGLGLGLSISRTIIERHGGRLWGERANGLGGATFHFTLPVES
jgi:PAS domain S-box-containing protein